VNSVLLVPGARSVDPGAARLLEADHQLRALVRTAVLEMVAAFEGSPVDVEYFAEHDSDSPDADERVFVAAYASASDRLARLRQVRARCGLAHEGTPPVCLSVHGT
jgi:hypothetical protein